MVEHVWLSSLPAWGHFATQIFFYGVAGSALAWWALTSVRRRVDETEAAQRALERAHTALSEANQRLEFLIQVNRRLAEVEDEEALIREGMKRVELSAPPFRLMNFKPFSNEFTMFSPVYL